MSSLRWVAAEGVSETVIAAVLLLHERSVDEIASKLRLDELGHVIRLVSRCPSCYPPGTFEALKVRSPAPAPKLAASTSTSARPAARIEPSLILRRAAFILSASMASALNVALTRPFSIAARRGQSWYLPEGWWEKNLLF
jgi:hypothetical protein